MIVKSAVLFVHRGSVVSKNPDFWTTASVRVLSYLHRTHWSVELLIALLSVHGTLWIQYLVEIASYLI